MEEEGAEQTPEWERLTCRAPLFREVVIHTDPWLGFFRPLLISVSNTHAFPGKLAKKGDVNPYHMPRFFPQTALRKFSTHHRLVTDRDFLFTFIFFDNLIMIITIIIIIILSFITSQLQFPLPPPPSPHLPSPLGLLLLLFLQKMLLLKLGNTTL